MFEKKTFWVCQSYTKVDISLFVQQYDLTPLSSGQGHFNCTKPTENCTSYWNFHRIIWNMCQDIAYEICYSQMQSKLLQFMKLIISIEKSFNYKLRLF